MKKYIQLLLDLPGTLNEKVYKSCLNKELDKFDSQAGVRSYTVTIYNWAGLLTFITLEYSAIKGALGYFQNDPANGLAKALSLLTILVSIIAAFPIAALIRSRGESLGNSHGGMVSFVFSDFVKTNVRLAGEIAALVGLFGAINLTISFLTDHNLYSGGMAMDIQQALQPIAGLPAEALHSIFKALDMTMLSDFFNSLSNYKFSGAGDFGGDFSWNPNDILGVAGAYLNVILGLILVYINLAIYGYIYNLLASLVSWISSPSLPISVKHKNV